MTLLFFLKQQPYPAHPYEGFGSAKTGDKKKKRKLKKRRRDEEAIPVSAERLPIFETIKEAAERLGTDIEKFSKFDGPDWEKILSEAFVYERGRLVLRDEKEFLELLMMLSEDDE